MEIIGPFKTVLLKLATYACMYFLMKFRLL